MIYQVSAYKVLRKLKPSCMVCLMCCILACRQQNQGLLPQGTNFDLFRGTAQGARDEIERYPTQVRC